MADEKEGSQELNLAKGFCKELLEQMMVSRVVLVDDRFAVGPAIEDVVALAEAAWELQARAVEHLVPDVPFDVPERGWSPDLKEYWEELDRGERDRLIGSLVAIAGAEGLTEKSIEQSPAHYLPKGTGFIALDPAEWLAQRDELIASATSDSRILCFFDQDLSDAEGFTESGSKSGIGLLKAVSEEADVICAILSNRVQPDDELEQWRAFSESVGVRLGNFLPISKARLESPLSFAAALKKTSMNRQAEEMKDLAAALFKRAAEAAAEDIQAIDPYDFDHIVLKSSHREGAAEIDTLLRVFDIFHRDRVKVTFLEGGSSRRLQELANQVRPMSRIGDGHLPEHKPKDPQALRHREVFENSELVNQFHSPLRNGDVFTELTTEANYVLLAQPCDAMVRTSGNRGGPGHGIFVPIEQDVDDKSERSASACRIDHVFDGEKHSALVKLSEAHVVRLTILDLCVLNSDGRCAIDVAKPSPIPAQFHQAWIRHRQKLLRYFEALADELDRSQRALSTLDDGPLREALRQRLVPSLTFSESDLNQGSYAERRFDFLLQRSGRVRTLWSDLLLREYMRWQSREAKPHEFAI